MSGPHTNSIRIKCHDQQTRKEWRRLTTRIDPDKDYEEILQMFIAFFEDDDRIASLRAEYEDEFAGFR